MQLARIDLVGNDSFRLREPTSGFRVSTMRRDDALFEAKPRERTILSRDAEAALHVLEQRVPFVDKALREQPSRARTTRRSLGDG